MQITIQLTEKDLKELVVQEIQRRAGEIPVQASDIKIETKSTQNYRSEWEIALFRATANINS